MKEFYEKYRESETGLLLIKSNDQTFPAHFHNNIEILICLDSRYEILQNGKLTVAKAPFVAFTDSYALHKYKIINKGEREDYSILIPKEYQHNFRKMCAGKKPVNTVIFDKDLAQKCIMLIDTYYSENVSRFVDAAIGEMMLSLVFGHLSFTEEKEKGDDIPIIKMLSYIDEHYKEPITLKSIAKEIGYRPEHLSRIFHKYMQTNVKTYINRQRVNAVLRESESGCGKNLSRIVFECGFNSLQSYYRNKKGL